MTLVFLFPGQSSRHAGMVDAVLELGPGLARIVEEASDTLGRDLRAHYRADHADAFARNLDVQVGVFLTNHLYLELLRGEGVEAPVSLGLSLGEWNHLVHIGALSFEAALRLVVARGEAYDAGPRGCMAAVHPIDLEALEAALLAFPEVRVTNHNSPTQQVIGGPAEAVAAVMDHLEEAHWASSVVIEQAVPMHHPSFAPVGRRLRAALEAAPFARPRLPYLPNLLGEICHDPTPARMIEVLALHVSSPVRWRESIDTVLDRWPDATFLEVGAMAVLTQLLRRPWCTAPHLAIDARSERRAHLAATLAQLRGPAPRPPVERTTWTTPC